MTHSTGMSRSAWHDAVRLTLLAFLVAVVTACSGGGGGGGSSSSSPTGGTVVPIIATQPQSQRVDDGQPVTFTVGAAGTGPLTYQYFRNGVAIPGANASTYTLGAVQLSDNGATFTVTVSNAAGTVTSAVATLTVAAVAPTITDNTAKTVTVVAGATATFSVTVTGSAPLAFQWRRNGVPIVGATSATYTTGATTLADSGAVFDVVVSNAAGSVTSAPFTLVVTPDPSAPGIATQPQATTVRAGASATFSVVASGPGPFTYQWLRNGVAIPGAQSPSYTLANAMLSDNGALFSVIVTNAAGSVTSAAAPLTVLPQPGIALVAGNVGGSGYINATGPAARFVAPGAVAVDASGRLFVGDGSTVRTVSTTGAVATYAGSPTSIGTADGTAASATFAVVGGVVVAPSGDVYVSDASAHTIRRITTAGAVTTLAGTPGTAGSADGTGSGASFNTPTGLALDAAGNLYVADTGNDTIRLVTPGGVVTTLAGTAGTAGSADGIGATATFNAPRGVAVDAAGEVFVADTGNDTIRLIASGGTVTTIAGATGVASTADGVGPAARFNLPAGATLDAAGNLYVSEAGGLVLRKVALDLTVTTVAGSPGVSGAADGTGAAAQFALPLGVAADASGNVYVADANNAELRAVSPTGVVSTVAGLAAVVGSADGTGSSATFNLPFSVAVDVAGTIYVGDYLNATVRRVSSAGVVTTLAGTPGSTGSADGTGAAARFATPQGLAVDSSGNVYVADRDNQTIRKITPGGVVTTLAGSPGVSGAADGTGSAATFQAPTALVADAAGNVYVVDSNPTVRRITPAGVVTTLAGGAGRVGALDGPGNVASFNLPQGIALDASGNLIVADSGNSTIRRVTPAGVVSTIAGIAGSSAIIDGPAGTARLSIPYSVVVDAGGNLDVVDIVAQTFSIGPGGVRVSNHGSHVIRRIDATGAITTVAGVADNVGGTLLGPFPGHFDSLDEIAIDATGNLVGADANGVLRITFP